MNEAMQTSQSRLRRAAMCAAIGAAMLVGGAANAQITPEIAAKVAAIGRIVDPPNTGAIYAPMHETEPYGGVKVTRDVKYGADPRNIIDIFVPVGDSAARPVLMFVHGGGMIAGIKRGPGSPYYDNVMYAELSDFFYVWLKRTAGHVFPELFTRTLTDKQNEAVANPAKFQHCVKIRLTGYVSKIGINAPFKSPVVDTVNRHQC